MELITTWGSGILWHNVYALGIIHGYQQPYWYTKWEKISLSQHSEVQRHLLIEQAWVTGSALNWAVELGMQCADWLSPTPVLLLKYLGLQWWGRKFPPKQNHRDVTTRTRSGSEIAQPTDAHYHQNTWWAMNKIHFPSCPHMIPECSILVTISWCGITRTSSQH